MIHTSPLHDEQGVAARARSRAIRLFALAALTPSVGLPRMAGAADVDRNAQFVEALQERGWDDVVVDFLRWVENSPLATPEFARQLPYRRAVSQAVQARRTRNLAKREQLLLEAASGFESFAAAHPGDPLAIDSLRQAANLHAEQALVILAASKQLPVQAVRQRQEEEQKSRDMLARATAAAQQVIDLAAEELASLPKAAAIQADPAAKSRRDHLRDRQVEARFLLARLNFEQAATFDRKSSQYRETLDEASSKFGQLVEEYRDSLVGTSSRFYQGRCAQELGAYEKALGCYEDILRLPAANPEFRRWTARAHRTRMECLLALGKPDDAVSRAEDWFASSRPAERKEPEWLEAAFRLADAYQAKIKQGKLSDGETKRLQSTIRNLLRDVSQSPNEFQQQARLALASQSRGDEAADPKNFADALSAGKTAIDLWNSSNLAAKLARENNPEAVEELQRQADDQRAEARRLLDLALSLADRQTPIDQLNAVRYYLCILYWEDKQLHEAAVLAEFLAVRYPESEYAASAAKVALAAYEALSIEAQAVSPPSADGETLSYETGKLRQLAELIAARWPESPEAASAANSLIQTALRESRLADAEALLAKLPPESRGAAELSLGAGLWTQYLRAAAANRENPSAEALALRDKAGGLLNRGFDSQRKQDEPNAASAVGALYLAQYLLANGQAQQALDVLQDENAGPLALVESEAEVAAKPEFVLETYKAALRAFLSAEPPQREQAERMMAALEQSVGQVGGEGAKKLTEVYLGLSVQLQRQLKELIAAGQDAKAQQLAVAFGDLLDRVAARPDANDWRVRGWIAQTNLQIGQALQGEQAKPYIDRAKAAYDAMLAAAASDPKYAPDDDAVLGVRMRLAECLAALGQHETAVEQYGAILRQRPNMLDLQKGAAKALQDWGVDQRNLDAFERSIRGDLPQANGKNLIWGWLRLASIANAARSQAAKASPVTAETRQRMARFEDLFFEARYNVARSRYLAGKAAPPAESREHFETAKANIEQMAQLYPGLGGPTWKPSFDELLKQVHQELADK